MECYEICAIEAFGDGIFLEFLNCSILTIAGSWGQLGDSIEMANVSTMVPYFISNGKFISIHDVACCGTKSIVLHSKLPIILLSSSCLCYERYGYP
jgi:hypothetical protein